MCARLSADAVEVLRYKSRDSTAKGEGRVRVEQTHEMAGTDSSGAPPVLLGRVTASDGRRLTKPSHPAQAGFSKLGVSRD